MNPYSIVKEQLADQTGLPHGRAVKRSPRSSTEADAPNFSPNQRQTMMRVPADFVFLDLVGLGGIEPPTSRLSGVRSNRLSYSPRDAKGNEPDRLLPHGTPRPQ